jgi:hypothetical protein
MSQQALLVYAAFLAVFSTQVFGAERKYDTQGCYSSQNHVIEHAEGFVSGSFDAVNMRLPDQYGNPLLVSHCIGTFMVLGGEPEINGVCEYADAAGDKILQSFARKGDPAKVEGTNRFIHGTGKYAGIAGEGKFKIIGEITPPGVTNMLGGCDHAWGTYSAPGIK